MALDRYVMNHRLLIRMQRSGNVFCAVCHKPIVEGQRVVWVTRVTARHDGCPVKVTSARCRNLDHFSARGCS